MQINKSTPSKWLNLHLHLIDKSPNLQEIKAQITKSTSKLGQIYSLQKAHTPPSCDRVLEKLIIEDPRLDLQKAVTKAAWVHNTNVARSGAIPL